MSEKILQRAEEYNFQLLTSSPLKLKDYFLREIVAPVAQKVININRDFYSVSKNSSETKVVFINETIVITVSEDKLKIFKEFEDGLLILLIVDYVDSKGYVGDHLLTKEKLVSTLESVFE